MRGRTVYLTVVFVKRLMSVGFYFKYHIEIVATLLILIGSILSYFNQKILGILLTVIGSFIFVYAIMVKKKESGENRIRQAFH